MNHYRLLTAILTSLVLVVSFGAAGASGPERSACLADPYGPGCTAGLPSVEYQMLLDEMLLHPKPDVRPLHTEVKEIESIKGEFMVKVAKAGTAAKEDRQN